DKQCLPGAPVDFVINLDNSTSSISGMASLLPASNENKETGEVTNDLLDPVKVSSQAKATSEKVFTLTVNAKIDEGWYVYSNKMGEDGPMPTTMEFDAGEHFKILGGIHETSDYKIDVFDEIFEMQLVKYKKFVSFSRDVEILDPTKSITGSFTYQTCDDSKCLPPKELAFSFTPTDGKFLIEGASEGIGLEGPKIEGDIVDQSNPILIESHKNPVGDCGGEQLAGHNLFWMFFFGFLGGLLALLTPCVFPMIPLTVSFFTKGSKDRASGIKNGINYGLSIIVIYVILGILITAVFGATALNELSTNWLANFIFFVIFIIFSFSFFGFYEITLPSSWSNKTDALADKGGLLGTFFMAFTLALVSFSCTGPIIGTAIVESASNKLGPTIVMLGFSVALALPFGLFAAFPAWLNSLPKSGSWMTSVKVVLGFLEMALALKFLSNADMANHWNILGYEIFMGLWVVLFALMTLYLFGLIRFPHDNPFNKLTKLRKGFAFGSLALTLYLATGFIYNKDINSYRSLALMSGLAPPSSYNYFLPKSTVNKELKDRFISFTKCANNLDCFKDYYEGLSYAKEVNKPMLVDYTGIFCVNCRKTEEQIWVVDNIRNKIAKDYVLVSLYCDDPKLLEKPLVSKTRNALLKTIGNKWSDFQIVNFNQNSQPLYVLVGPNEEVLAKPRGYHASIQEYEDFLNCGLDAFNQKKTLGLLSN
ncbi:MAG: hypothetical protein M3Q56_09760, partial [Bacteroidota bacterium]|nr:hypothetical protein [Bacteroidota bacterium]